MAAIRSAAQSRCDGTEPEHVHDQRKVAITVTATDSTLKDRMLKAVMNMRGDSGTCELTVDMNACVVGGFANKEEVQNVITLINATKDARAEKIATPSRTEPQGRSIDQRCP